MNVLVSFYAMVNIVGIVICCIGFMVAAGWQLGTIEGICITVCIGFSVDFVVHVAIAYIESNAETRYERTRVALGEMGISVLGATLTTGISSLIMIAAPMIPFSKIGIFVTFDIFVSLLFAVGLYPSMLASFGPEGTSGSIRWLLCHNACPYRKTTGAKSAAVAPL
jgi:predicted RND superfamily exporter protein